MILNPPKANEACLPVGRGLKKEKRMRGKKGFTLIEVLIVVIILGILATIATPQLTNTVRRARLGEAWSSLGALKTGLGIYFLDLATYVGATTTNLDVPNPPNFTLSLPTLTATTYIARATGSTAHTTNVVAEINQAGQRRYSLTGVAGLPATWSS